MKAVIKRILVSVAFALATVAACFAEGSDYEILFAKARRYEEQGRYMYALGTYWDAMKADPKKAKDAYYAYVELAKTLSSGNPGYGEFDEFSIYDGWLALCKDFEQYWTENCPNCFQFGIRKGELDMETRTATYYVHITVDTSSKYDNTAGFVLNGLKSKRQKSWTGIPELWPLLSVYWKEDKSTMKDGIALFRPIIWRDQYNSIPASLWYLWSDKTNMLHYETPGTLYDVKFNITDENGKVLLASGRKRMGSTDDYEFKKVPQDIMKIIDSGKARIVPTGVWLEYGQLSQDYNDKSREWLKPLPEITQDLQKLEFYLPGGMNSKDSQVIGNTKFYINDTGVVNTGKFYIMKTEVTWGQYSAITGVSIPESKGNFYPVSKVNWYDAIEYCNLLSTRQGLTPCYSIRGESSVHVWNSKGFKFTDDEIMCDFKANGWRLPTIQEWQYAARGGKSNDKYIYSGSNNINEVAWNYKNSDAQSHEVATKMPNSLGLYDMTGNVAEWCWDKFGKSFPIFMGGSFYYTMGNGEISDTSNHKLPTISDSQIGFRMVRNAEELPELEQEAVSTSSASDPKADAESVTDSAEAKKETESTESKAKAKEKAKEEEKKKAKEEEKKAKEEEKKAKKEEKKKAKEEKKEQEVKKKAAASAESEDDAEDDSDEEGDDEEKSNIFTKAKDKAKDAKDKVVETADKVKDKMTSKKKDKKKDKKK